MGPHPRPRVAEGRRIDTISLIAPVIVMVAFIGAGVVTENEVGNRPGGNTNSRS
jgi:hypothetical protein